MNDIRISFIVPCYNCSKTVGESINSITSLELKDYEICLIDDGSTDNTFEILKKHQQKYPSHIKIGQNPQNLGGATTRNNCVKMASNHWIFCLDSDNILHKKSFFKTLNSITNMDKLVAFSAMDFFYSVGPIKFPVKKWSYKRTKMVFSDMRETSAHPVSSGNYFFTKDIYNLVSGYETDVGALDAYSLGYKALINNLEIKLVEDTKYFHRLSFNSYWIRENNNNNENLRKLLTRYTGPFSQEEVEDIKTAKDVNEVLINRPNTFTEIQDSLGTKFINLIKNKV